MTNEERLIAIFEELMHGEVVPVRERSRSTAATWDSLCQLSLIIAIEQEFDITMSDQDAMDLRSFAIALAIVDEATGLG